MPSTVEINNNSERLALRRTIESVLASKTAEELLKRLPGTYLKMQVWPIFSISRVIYG